MPKLEWKLLTKKRASSTHGIPPGKEDLAWVTNSVTLIYGQRDAVLVDTFLSAQQSRELVDWVVESGVNLVAIYVTHGHGDHFFGLKMLLDKFPNAKALATAHVVAASQNQIEPDFMKSFWEPRFPGQLPSQLLAPEVLDGDSFYLEGEALKVVELGHTDTSHSTALHLPSIGLVGYEVTMVRDATTDYSDVEMHAALDVNIPNYAVAIVSTNEIEEAIASL
jgi:glyoxylase-like metal-dependent hydrolase (beta-lactamase superfamily II)